MIKRTNGKFHIENGQVVGYSIETTPYEKDLLTLGMKLDALKWDAMELAEKYGDEATRQPDETNIENIIAVIKVATRLCNEGVAHAQFGAMNELLNELAKSSNGDE